MNQSVPSGAVHSGAVPSGSVSGAVPSGSVPSGSHEASAGVPFAEGPSSSQWRKAGEFLAWTGLIAIGARRGGLIGLAAMGIGLEKLSQLTLGTSISQLLLTAVRSPEPEYQFGEGTRDLVDEASWESFPASDPPGRGVG